MAAKKIVDEFFVKVRPITDYGKWSLAKEKRACEDVRLQILGECDVYDVTVETVSHFECEFCGQTSTTEEVYGCCKAADEEHWKIECEKNM